MQKTSSPRNIKENNLILKFKFRILMAQSPHIIAEDTRLIVTYLYQVDFCIMQYCDFRFIYLLMSFAM